MPKKPKTSKDLIRHAKLRALQRFKIEFTNADIYAIKELIITGKSTFLGRRSNKRAYHKINYNNYDLVVVYDNEIRMVVTFLEPEMAKNNDFINKNLLTNVTSCATMGCLEVN